MAAHHDQQAQVAQYMVSVQEASGVRFPGQPEGTQTRRTWNRDISESKAIQGLNVFHGGGKGYYKEWHAKFVNVFTQ
eukprot:9459465-Alexandrium_andersonii.AAC.1